MPFFKPITFWIYSEYSEIRALSFLVYALLIVREFDIYSCAMLYYNGWARKAYKPNHVVRNIIPQVSSIRDMRKEDGYIERQVKVPATVTYPQGIIKKFETDYHARGSRP